MVSVNHAAVEALCSATYLEDYIDCLDSLPDDLQRSITRLRELDCKLFDYLQDLNQNKEIYLSSSEGQKKQTALAKIQRFLVKCQETGDEKLQIVSGIMEQIEGRTRQLEQNLENLDPANATSNSRPITLAQATPSAANKTNKTDTKVKIEPESSLASAGKKRSRRQRVLPSTSTAAAASPVTSTSDVTVIPKEEKKASTSKQEEDEKPVKKKRKKKGKQKAEKEDNPLEDFDIDPNEPVYCLCQRVSYGEMIGCDYEQCDIEWFHFDCVNLTNKPKGKWFCPNCRGDKPTVKRPDLKG